MDRNKTNWVVGYVYCFYNPVTAARIGVKCKKAGFEIEYIYNEWNDPSFLVTGIKERGEEEDE